MKKIINVITMKIKYKIFLYFLTLFLSLNLQTFASSKIDIDFNSLPFHSSHPEHYSLFMVDSSHSLSLSQDVWKSHKNFENVKMFLREDLAEDKDISFVEDFENVEKKKNRWLGCHKHLIKKQDSYIVRLMKRNIVSNIFKLASIGSEAKSDEYIGFNCEAALIIFPHPNQKAMIFGLGNWKTLLKKSSIVPQWGLKMLSSDNMFINENKSITVKYYNTTNPSSKSEKKAKLATIENFGIEVGLEGLDSIRSIPNKERYKTSHVMEGKDFLKFTISNKKADHVNQSLVSLRSISNHFFEVTNDKNFKIHKSMREYIDIEIREKKDLNNLNKKLLELITTDKDVSHVIFFDNTLWKDLNSKLLFLNFENKKVPLSVKSLSEVFTNLKYKNLFQEVEMYSGRKKDQFHKLKIADFLYSIPIEHDEKYFRFDKGRWYEVDASRFEAIKRLMRNSKLNQNNLNLPSYTLEDIENEKSYKEARYNCRTVNLIGQEKNWDAVLLDRLNLSLGSSKDIFEFADFLLSHNNEFYLVHAKRAKVKALSHHCDQAERCADFLATELKKDETKDLILKGVINDLYQSHGISIKAKDREKRLTKGSNFQKYFSSLKGEKISTSSIKHVLNNIGNYQTTVDQKIILELSKKLFNYTQDDFFKNYLEQLFITFDAMFDCIDTKKNQKKVDVNKEFKELEKFIPLVEKALRIQQTMFQSGIAKRDFFSKINIVLLVIDDRNIDRIITLFEEINKNINDENKSKLENYKKLILTNKDISQLDDLKKLLTSITKKIKNKKDEKKLESITKELINRIESKNKSKNQEALFKNQDLWRLNRTKNTIQKHGLKFKLIVVDEDINLNESGCMDWDAFGKVIHKRGRVEDSKSSPKLIDTKTNIEIENCSDISDVDDSSDALQSPSKKRKLTPQTQIDRSPKFSFSSIKDSSNIEFDDLDVLSTDEDGSTYSDEQDKLEKTKDSKKFFKFGSNVEKQLTQIKAWDFNLELKKIFNKTKLNLSKVQELSCGMTKYYKIPTIGDGDCFFHSVFTESGKDKTTLQKTFLEMRESVVGKILANNDYKQIIKEEIIGFYRNMYQSKNTKYIHEKLFEAFKKSDKYDKARGILLGLMEDKLLCNVPLPLPQSIYSHNHILNLIEDQDIENYLKKYTKNEGDEYYIQIPTGTKGSCIAEIIARIYKIKINVFTLDESSQQIHFSSSVGLENSQKTANILLDGMHFSALFSKDETVERRSSVLQTLKNATDQ